MLRIIACGKRRGEQSQGLAASTARSTCTPPASALPGTFSFSVHTVLNKLDELEKAFGQPLNKTRVKVLVVGGAGLKVQVSGGHQEDSASISMSKQPMEKAKGDERGRNRGRES